MKKTECMILKAIYTPYTIVPVGHRKQHSWCIDNNDTIEFIFDDGYHFILSGEDFLRVIKDAMPKPESDIKESAVIKEYPYEVMREKAVQYNAWLNGFRPKHPLAFFDEFFDHAERIAITFPEKVIKL